MRKGVKHFETVLANQEAQVLEMVHGKKSTCIQEALKHIPHPEKIEKVCMDMCSSFAHAVQNALPHAEIITDRFHLVRHLNKHLNTRRKSSHAQLDKGQRKRFSRIHFLLSKNDLKLGKDDRRTVADYLRLNPKIKPLYKLAQRFKQEVLNKDWKNVQEAAQSLRTWVDDARKAFPDFVKTVEKWWQPVLNACLFKESNGRMEGMNQKIKLIKRQGFGYPERELFKLKVMAAFNP